MSDDVPDLSPKPTIRALWAESFRLEHLLRELTHVKRRLSDQAIPALRGQTKAKADA